MRVRDTFPNELWLEIFEHLPRKSLSQASLTAHSFWRLARPFIFRHFRFHPYAYYDSRFYHPSPERMARAKERLHFWLSGEIAPFVHSCRISPWSERHCQDSTDSPNILLDILLLQLPSFTNLWHLSANCATFTGAAMSTLRGMSTLRHLEIERCWVDAEQSLESFSPALTLFAFSGLTTYRCPLAPWIPFLRPDTDHLRELRLLCQLRDWNTNSEAIPVYPHVRRLTLNWSNTGTHDCLAVLSRFPNVRVAQILDFVGHDRRFNPPVSNTFPFLKVLTVSCTCLPVMLPRAPLGKLTVSDGTAKELISRLEEVDKSATVAIYSLRLDSISLDPEGLKKILQYFPHLVRLRVEANFSSHDIATMLFTVFPCVSFSQSKFESVSISATNPESVAVRRALMEKSPLSLRLEGPDFELRWRMHGDGIVEEDYVPVQSEVDNLSPEAEELLACLRKYNNFWWIAGDNASNLGGPSTVM